MSDNTSNQDVDYKKVVHETGQVVDAGKITGCFYANIFSKNPGLKAYFNQSHQREKTQPAALADAVCAYAANIYDLTPLVPAVTHIAEKHCAFSITPELYPYVGENLLAAIKETHGVDDSVLECWGKAYGDLAKVFIDMEEGIYARNESAEGGWRGYKEWTVSKKVVESDEIVSVYFTCNDAVPSYKPGNYITIKPNIHHDDGVPLAPRNYSISDWSKDHFRISVKREVAPEESLPNGLSSNWVHDSLQEGDLVPIAFPCGDFFISDTQLESTSIVLYAGGVGITALLCMFKYLDSVNYTGQVYLIHAVKTKESQSHKEEINKIVSARDNFHYFTFFSRYEGSVDQGEHVGRINSTIIGEILQSITPESTSVYSCGPNSFMRSTISHSKKLGIPETNIHYEFFSTSQGNLLIEE